MAYDEALATRIRAWLGDAPNVTERKMFGGIAFMVNGNMFAGVIRDDLMARVGGTNYDAALQRPGVRLMDFAGRPMKGMVYVEPAALTSDAIHVLARAAEAAGTLDGPALRQALAALPAHDGASGVIHFQGSGDPARSVVVSGIRDGEVHFVTSVDPR